MAILNQSKLRPDILALSESRQPVILAGLDDFLQKKENQKLNFDEIWSRNLKGNEYFFKNKKVDDYLFNLLSFDERCFLARALRYATEYSATVDQEKKSVARDVKFEKSVIEGIPVEWQNVRDSHPDRVLLYIHGGGWILGSPKEHRLLSTAIAKNTGIKAISIDYRLAPEYPHPAQREDCVAVYKWLISNYTKPENIIIGGDSAGGHLTLTTLLHLRDNRVPLPAGAVLLSPATDLSMSDESFFNNGETDPILSDIGLFWWLSSYISSYDVKDPSISPLFGDLMGLPPLLFQASSSEMLYSDTTRFVEKAKDTGVDVTMEIWEDMPHVFQSFGLEVLQETQEALDNINKFTHRIFDIFNFNCQSDKTN